MTKTKAIAVLMAEIGAAVFPGASLPTWVLRDIAKHLWECGWRKKA